MKLQRFASCSALCLAPFLLTACNSAQVATPVSVAPISNEVHQLKNGLRVEMLPVQSNDLANLLDATIWKFRVSSANKTNRMLISSVKILKNGKVVRIVGVLELYAFDGETTEVSVAMMPMENSELRAKKFKLQVRVNGSQTSNTFANPFEVSSTLVTTGRFHSNDTILLMAGSTKSQSYVATDSTTNPVSLVLSFTTRPIKRTQK